jgi:hypothetical protein
MTNSTSTSTTTSAAYPVRTSYTYNVTSSAGTPMFNPSDTDAVKEAFKECDKPEKKKSMKDLDIERLTKEVAELKATLDGERKMITKVLEDYKGMRTRSQIEEEIKNPVVPFTVKIYLEWVLGKD